MKIAAAQVDVWRSSTAETAHLEIKEAKNQYDTTKQRRYRLAIANEGRDRVRACFQHCVLQYVQRKQMTNQSLRKRFGLSEGSSNTVSQIITATLDQGLIKNDPNAPESRRYARYIPAWD